MSIIKKTLIEILTQRCGVKNSELEQYVYTEEDDEEPEEIMTDRRQEVEEMPTQHE
jgi:hypothetical protein